MTSKLERYIEVAKVIASMSKDPSTKVGAVAVDEEFTILSTGYNGFPRGISDDPALLSDKEEKYKRVVHAEENLVAHAARKGTALNGCTVIVSGLFPCSSCAGLLIQSGVKQVVVHGESPNRWNCEVAREMFNEAKVKVIEL